MAEEGHSIPQIIKRFRTLRYGLVLEGVGVGVAAGLVTILFRILLEQADVLRVRLLSYCSVHPLGAVLWVFACAAASVLVTLLVKWEPLIAGSGIPQVEGEMQGRIKQTWWRVLTAKLVGGVLTIGTGLSLGREGPSIQLGAMAGKGVARLSKRGRTEEKMLLTCGASAGLAAAFNAPLAGVLFSLEEVHKNFSVEVLLSAMSASITADFISRNVFGLKPVFDFSSATMMPLKSYWLVAVLGVLLGLLGVCYNRCVAAAQNLYDRVHQPFVKTLIPFCLTAVLGLCYPMVLGGGHNLVGQVSNGMALSALLLLLAVKFFFSMASFGAGVPGGIFLPLLVLGAVTGGLFSGLCGTVGLETQLPNFVILGMAGLFAAIVRAPVTGIILISEMTGSFSHLLTLSLVSLIAYAVADLMRAEPIYEQLLHRILRKSSPDNAVQASGEKMLVESPIHPGALICNQAVHAIDCPAGALIVSVKRGETEIVPHGETLLLAGDILVVLCDESLCPQVHDALERQCRTVQVS